MWLADRDKAVKTVSALRDDVGALLRLAALRKQQLYVAEEDVWLKAAAVDQLKPCSKRRRGRPLLRQLRRLPVRP